MIAAAAMTRDALDGDGQVAIALGDHGHELVHLLGRLGRCFDLDPAANAVEDGFGIEGIGSRQHVALHLQWEDQWTGVNVTLESGSTELNQTLAYFFCWSMIFSENRFPLFRIMLWRVFARRGIRSL